MINIFAKSEERRKTDEGMIMAREEEEMKRTNKKQKETKIKNKKIY